MVGTVEQSDDPRWRPGRPRRAQRRRARRVASRRPRREGQGRRRRTRPHPRLDHAPSRLRRSGPRASRRCSPCSLSSATASTRHEVADSGSSVLVTGAAGGVGSVAIALLAKLGYPVTASTGRAEEVGGLPDRSRARRRSSTGPSSTRRESRCSRSAGRGPWTRSAARRSRPCSRRPATAGPSRRAASPRGRTCRRPSCPFILRAVTLVGINSVEAPAALRETAWRRLATDLDEEALAAMTRFVTLARDHPGGRRHPRRPAAGSHRGRRSRLIPRWPVDRSVC